MDMATAQQRREMREHTRQVQERAYLISRQWWRVLRNRRLRREIAGLLRDWDGNRLRSRRFLP